MGSIKEVDMDQYSWKYWTVWKLIVSYTVLLLHAIIITSYTHLLATVH